MKTNPFAPELSSLPKIMPIFPLSGVLLLPSGELPLNIFEPRYLAMVEEALATSKLIGMVQPRQDADPNETNRPVYDTGCAGKIIEYQETSCGRYLITLSGISRFNITQELPVDDAGFRRVKPCWIGFENDIHERKCLKLNRDKLKTALEKYFQMHNMDCDWNAIDEAADGRLITCLSMICPFSPIEKQALLEAEECKARSDLFLQMLEMEIHGTYKGSGH